MQAQVPEGDWNPGRSVTLKSKHTDLAHKFYNSPEYLKARSAREGAAIMRMVLVKGLQAVGRQRFPPRPRLGMAHPFSKTLKGSK
ncbi:hypothetical protein GCM10010975_31570 [Comamonas phosphati]|nr:hypothetical protein GCM10010975_31570 [Comamonas phosphati]